MHGDRRDFVKTAAVTATAMAAGCSSEPISFGPQADPTDTSQSWSKTVCRFCGTGCGVQISIRNNRLIALRGDAEHPTTKGLCCTKALFLPKILHTPHRLTRPMIRRDGALQPASWDEAMELVASKFAGAVKRLGPDGVAFYGSGQLYSEESYLANRLFKGGIGTNNVEGNPRLCMASAVGGYVSSFGKDEPMGSYDDIPLARVFLIVGSNTPECHPVLYDQIIMNRHQGRRAKVVVIDPRKTPLAESADVYMQPLPGHDLEVLHAIAYLIIKNNQHDPGFISNHVVFRKGAGDDASFEEYVKFLEDYTPEKVAASANVSQDDIRRAAQLIAAGPTMSLWTMGVNQRVAGVWCNNLIHNLHLITGQIGKPGATPFSLTGQPNACGGVRDTGSLCHILPYGRVVAKPEHRAAIEKLWGCKPGTIQEKPGLNTIELFKAVAEDKVQAMLVMTTNPGHSLPNANAYRDAMGKPRKDKPFIVVADGYPTETTELADVVLPAAVWIEKEGVFGMSERRYQLLEKVVDPPGEARSDFDILVDLATRLEEKGVVPKGYIAGKLSSPAEVWDEMREAGKDTPYDFYGITRARLKLERGLRWPCPNDEHPGTSRRYVKGEDPLLDEGPYADDSLKPGAIKFYAGPDNKAMVWLRPFKPPAEPTDSEYPYSLSTGRVLEHWHTGTMTMHADELRSAHPQAFVEVHPDDAKELGVGPGDRLHIESRRGKTTIPIVVTDRPQRKTVFVPFHYAKNEHLINLCTIDAYDPGSKQPEYKICAVKLSRA